MAWIGCAYTAKKRSHLRFEELRSRLPYAGQFCAMMLDHVIWIGFSIIIIYYSAVEQVQLSYDNFAIVPGTDNVMQWWFYMATPGGLCADHLSGDAEPLDRRRAAGSATASPSASRFDMLGG